MSARETLDRAMLAARLRRAIVYEDVREMNRIREAMDLLDNRNRPSLWARIRKVFGK